MWLGLVVMSVLIGLALILAAGTLNYWQAWVFLGVGAVSSVLLTLSMIKNPILLENRTKVRTDGREKNHPKNHRVVRRDSGHRRVHRPRA